MKSNNGILTLEGLVAVVTGGTGGLGFDIADAFASLGGHVIITSRTPERSVESVQKLRGLHGTEVVAMKLDQSDHRSVAHFADEAKNWKGRIDILVNNAGGGSGKGESNFLLRSPEEVAQTIGSNLTGVIYCCQAVGRVMVEQKKGKIINIASVAGLIGRTREIYRRNGVREIPADYGAAKAGVLGLTRDLAAFLGPYNIQVNSISPGGFDKGNLPRPFVADFAALTPLGRMGRLGSDIKAAAAFLASAGSDYVTGQNLSVDGGFTAAK